MATKRKDVEEDMVLLERKQPTPYEVNYPNQNGTVVRYTWVGATPKKPSIKPVPVEVYEYLKLSTQVFTKGRLVLSEQESEERKEDLEYDLGSDNIPVVMSIEEIQAILDMQPRAFKAKIETIDRVNLDALVDLAIRTKLDSDSKKTAIAKTVGVDKDLLFSSDN